MNQNSSELSSVRRDVNNELENLSPAEINARQWISVSQRFLDSRIDQYEKYGNPEAQKPEFMDNFRATLEFLTEQVEKRDFDTISFLSTLEASASNGQSVETPNYIVLHGNQLSHLSLMVEEAQRRHDSAQ